MQIEQKLTENKIITEYVLEYVKQNKLQNEVVDLINDVRIYKQAIIPAELVGARGYIILNTMTTLKQKVC